MNRKIKYIVATRILVDDELQVKLFEFNSEQDRKSFIKDIWDLDGLMGYATTEN